MIHYEHDFYGWTQEQAALLRARRLNDLDIDNLIEEIESMGRSEKRALESSLTVLLMHLLKWKYQPQRRSRSWQLTIKTQRINFSKTLRENPGLNPKFAQCLVDAYQIAVLKAAQETDYDTSIFPVECPWNLVQITDDSFYPD